MNLTKDTYERLGLEGKKSQFYNTIKDKYGESLLIEKGLIHSVLLLIEYLIDWPLTFTTRLAC